MDDTTDTTTTTTTDEHGHGDADESAAAAVWGRHEDGETRRAAAQAIAERRAGLRGRRIGANAEAVAQLRAVRADCDVPPGLLAVAHRMLESPLSCRLAEAGVTVRDLKRSCYFSARLHTDDEREAALRAVEDGAAATVSGWFVALVRRRVADEGGKLDLMDETLSYEEHRAARSRLSALGLLPDPDDTPPVPAPSPALGGGAAGPVAPPAAAGDDERAYVGTAGDLAALIYDCDSIVMGGRRWRADDRAHDGRRLNLDALIARDQTQTHTRRSISAGGGMGDVVPLIRPAQGLSPVGGDGPPADAPPP